MLAEWEYERLYRKGDKVVFNGSIYTALKDHNGCNPGKYPKLWEEETVDYSGGSERFYS